MTDYWHGAYTPIKTRTGSSVQPRACNCIGPQNGQPMCPCAMRTNGVFERDGRWVQPERDLGPAKPQRSLLEKSDD